MDTVAEREQSELSRLEVERQESIAELEHMRLEMRSMAEPSADEADVDAYEREKTWALMQTLKRKVESLDHAIHLAQLGTYGTCEGCGGRIAPARLEILPAATLCLDCQREFERRNKRMAS